MHMHIHTHTYTLARTAPHTSHTLHPENCCITYEELNLQTDVSTMYLCCQQLSGTLPTELGRLSNLRNLEFYQNSLSGFLPTCYQNLTLDTLYGDRNNLTGDLSPLISMLNSYHWLLYPCN